MGIIYIYMGVSLNRGTPKTPQTDHFLVGKPMVVRYHHFRKPLYNPEQPTTNNHQFPGALRLGGRATHGRDEPKSTERTKNWGRELDVIIFPLNTLYYIIIIQVYI